MDERKTLDEALKQLVGEQLSSVEFVQNYLQLRFDGPCLTVYMTVHQVVKNDAPASWGQPGYRDVLCGLITHKVKRTQILPSESLSLTLDDDSISSMSLRDSDYSGPEALMFTDGVNEVCYVI